MRLAIAFLALAGVLACAPAASADPAMRIVGDLAARTCIPAEIKHDLSADLLPEGLDPLTDADLKGLNFTDGGRYWLYRADDDKVFVEVVDNKCRVFTATTGSADFLKTLEESITDAYDKPVQLSDKAHSSNPTLRIRVYQVHVDGAVVAVTYPTDATPAKDRMFYVVVQATKDQ